MGKFIKFTLSVLIFFATIFAAQAAPVVKITGLEFDNSDNLVIIKSVGKIFPKTMQTPEDNDKNIRTPENVITKCFLDNPDRVFVDISNAVLAGNQRTYTLKNSSIDTVKISQFSTNPHTVRIVFEYNKKFDPKEFAIYANDRQIIIRYGKTLVSSERFKTFYNNMTSGERNADIFEAATYSSETKEKIINVANTTETEFKTVKSKERDTQLKALFYLNSINPLQSGFMIKGSGLVSLKSSFVLENPTRVVYDIENANVAQDLRNKSFTFPASNSLVQGASVTQREILRVGQNTPSTARIVIQGNNAKDYRLVLSPDLQGLFIAKRTQVLNSKLTETTSSVVSYEAKDAGENLNVVNIKFTNPVALSAFEENSKFYLDLQNVVDLNEEAIKKLHSNPDYTGITAQKIATEKTRVIFHLKDSTAINAQISPDAKEVRIYFKKRVKNDLKPVVVQPKKEEPKETPRPSEIKQMYSVVIDPGHGGSDVGATRDNIYEKDITLEVSKLLEGYLKKQGVYTHMTRDRDKTVELSERSDFSNSIEPDVFISVHVNSTVKEDVIGLETHWYHAHSLEFAQKVHSKMASSRNLSKWETLDRGLFQSKFYVINHTNAPAILVEIGFISNPNERRELMKEKRREEIAKSLADGIMEYLKSRK